MLSVLVNIASTLEEERDCDSEYCHVGDVVRNQHWVVHVVRNIDSTSEQCAVVTRSGRLVDMDSDLHAALLQASDSHSTTSLLPADALLDRYDDNGPIVQMRYSCAVHRGTRSEDMQQALEQQQCDLVPLGDDSPPITVVAHDAHAVLGILLALEHIRTQSLECDSQRPSPRQSPRSGKESECVTA